MISFDPLLLLTIIFVSSGLTGLPISFAAFKKTDLGIIEKGLIGLTLGLLFPPLAIFIANWALGINFDLGLALGTYALIAIAGIAWAFKEKVWEEYKGANLFPLPPKEYSLESVYAYLAKLAPLFMLLIVIASFLIRYQSYSPVFSEIDPYWYLYGSGQLISGGHIPLTDNVVWYPVLQTGHRATAQIHTLWASWYEFYTQGGAYNNYLLVLVAGFYAPIFAALTAFFAYLIFSREYGKSIGLAAAGVLSAVPIFIQNTGGGQSQMIAANFLSLMFVYASIALALRFKDLRFAALAGFAVFTGVLSTNMTSVLTTTLFLFAIFESILLFFDNKKEDFEFFLKLIAVIGVFHIAASELKTLYLNGFGLSFSLLVFLGLAFGAVLYGIRHFVKEREMRVYALAGIFVIGIVFVFVLPFGKTLLSFGKDQLSGVLVYDSVFRTIAEQGPAPTSYQGQYGFIGMDLSGLGAILAVPFQTVANKSLELFGLFVNLLFGLPSSIPKKDPGLTMAIFGCLIIAFLVGMARVIGSIFKPKSDPSTCRMLLLAALFLGVLGTIMTFVFAPLGDFIIILGLIAAIAAAFFGGANSNFTPLPLLLLFAIFPTSFGGLYRLKFMSYLGIFSVLSLCFFFGELKELLKSLGPMLAKEFDSNKQYLKAAFAFFLVLIVVAQYTIPTPWGAALLTSSLTQRYQDNPAAFTDKFTQICAQTSDTTVCQSVKDPNFLNSTVNQFNSNLCFISVASNYSSPTIFDQIATNFKCGKIGDYWINSMDWIRQNVPDGDRVISWWDYGHWINFYGEKDAVIGNTQASYYMIERTAFAYTKGTPQDLIDTMKAFGSHYALFDIELVGSYDSFGGKYGALNYLACNYLNQTDQIKSPGDSQCEADYTWENIYVPASTQNRQPCSISDSQKITGVIGSVPIRAIDASGQAGFTLAPTYCLGPGKLANGQQLPIASYYLNKKDDNGNLVLNKDLLKSSGQQGDYYVFSSFYTKDVVWPGPDGTAVSGWEDRKGKFYDTNLYNAFFNEDLPGFTLVYKTPDNNVKIYKMNGN